MAFTSPDSDQSDRVLEELHRDARGNPRKLLDLACHSSASPWPTAAIGSDRAAQANETSPVQRTADRSSAKDLGERDRAPSPEPKPAIRSATGFVTNAPTDPPILGSSKPPLRIEEGLVEVGWDGDLETEASETEYSTAEAERPSADDTSLNEELIEDRYAALQAWTEWTKIQEKAINRGGAAEGFTPRVATEPQTARTQTVSTDADSSPHEPMPASATTGVRAETQHEFAPYSQLFSRLRQSKQP